MVTMNHLRISIYHFAIAAIVLCLWLVGCAAQKPFTKVIHMPATTYIITDHVPDLNGKKVISLCYKGGNLIYVKGYRQNGKIVPYMKVLGHEVQHMLNYYDSEIVDPHDITF